MNILRWTFGIPIALGLSVFIFSLIEDNNEISAMAGDNVYLLSYFLTLAVILCSGGFILLSSFLVPAPKRYGSLISSVICIIYIFYWLVISRDPFALPSSRVFYIGMCAGIIVGFTLSYLLFYNRGWRMNVES